MNDKDRFRYESCKRSAQFGKDFSVPAGSMIETLFAALAAKVDETETAAGKQSAGFGESAQQFGLKSIDREDLMDLLTAPANAARAAEPTNPGTQARFRFDRNLNDADLLAKANSFIACDAAEETLLITFMAPKSWKSDLATGAAAFDAAFSAAASADDFKVAGTAEVKQKVNEAMQIKRSIGYMIPNVFATNPAALAAWASASHVEAVPKKKNTVPLG